jgi:hypothetical protein
MSFDRNQKDFPSLAHRMIWSHGLLLVPPALSLAEIDGEHREAFLDLYHWMTDMYLDMYGNPGAYCIDFAGWDATLHGQTPAQAKISAKHHKQKQRLWELQELNERTKLPHMLLGRLVERLRPGAEGCAMELPVFEKPFMGSLENYCRYKMSEDAFLEMIGRCGLRFTRQGESVLFSNEKYPGMFAALLEWQSRLLNRKWTTKYNYGFAVNHLDCRIFQPGFQLTFGNSQWYMSGEVIAYLTEIAAVLSEHGLQWKGNRCTQLRCDYKGEHLAGFGMDLYPWFRVLMFKPGSPEMAAFEREVRKRPDAEEIIAFCSKTLHRCAKCGCHPVPPPQLGRWCEFFGKRVNLCGAWYGFTTRDFGEKSLGIMKILIRLNCRIIKEGQKLHSRAPTASSTINSPNSTGWCSR